MIIKTRVTILMLGIMAFSLTSLKPVHAAGFLPDCDISGSATNNQASRPCALDDFLVLAINLINYMLAISGSLALLFFIYGGFKWLTSAGNSSSVDEGKKILTSAALGLLIVFASWMIVNFVYTTMYGTGQKDGAQKVWWTNKK